MTPLEFHARRTSANPAFLGYLLAVYAEAEGLSEEALAARLACSPDHLRRLRMSLRPRTEPEHFWSDIEEIAALAAIDPDTLADLVNRADTVLAFQSAEANNALMAARDHAPDAPDEDQP